MKSLILPEIGNADTGKITDSSTNKKNGNKYVYYSAAEKQMATNL